MGFLCFSCCAALEQQDRLDREAHRIVRKPKRTPLFCAAALTLSLALPAPAPAPPPKPPFCHGCARYGRGCVRPCYRDVMKK